MSENRKVRPLVTNRPHANDRDPRSIFYAASSRDLDPFSLQRRVIPYGCKRSDIDHGSRSAGVQGELQHDTPPPAEHLGMLSGIVQEASASMPMICGMPWPTMVMVVSSSRPGNDIQASRATVKYAFGVREE